MAAICLSVNVCNFKEYMFWFKVLFAPEMKMQINLILFYLFLFIEVPYNVHIDHVCQVSKKKKKKGFV